MATTIMTEMDGIDTENLYTSIYKFKVHGLGLTKPEDAQEIIKSWGDKDDTTHSAKSIVDDQMIIHIPFIQNVHITTLLLKHAGGEHAPTRLQMYANRPDIVGFDEAENMPSHLDIALESGVEMIPYPIRSAKLASVHSLSLFFRDAEGGERVEVYYIGFRGRVLDQRREGTQKLEIPAANAPDAKIVDRLAEKSGGQQTTAR